MRIQTKICCIQSVSEAELVLAAGADALGLVGPMPSGPGILTDLEIRDIVCALPDAQTVLLTSETEVEAVCAHAARIRPKVIQLVDQVDAAVIPALRTLYRDLKIWQVIHVAGEAAIDQAKAAEPQADAILLDSGAPNAAVKQLGGTGRVHNWEISARIVSSCTCPVWLAGGLSPDNVATAIQTVRPYGVDICSGLRPAGALDQTLLEQFLNATKQI